MIQAGEVAAEIKIKLEKKCRMREKKLAALSTGDEEGEGDVAVVKKHAAEEAVQMKEEAPATGWRPHRQKETKE